MTQILLRDGCQLSYTVQGDGPPVALIQGVGVHGDGWLPQVQGLAERYTCLRFDNRGMGLSQPMGNPLTIEQMAQDSLAIIDHLGWDRVHLVGHSLGGLIALHLALHAPSRVRSLALLCTFADGRQAAPMTARMIWLGTRTRLGTRTMRRRAFLRLVMPSGRLRSANVDELIQKWTPLFGHDLGEQPPIVGHQLKAMKLANFGSRLGEIVDVPTLVVSASKDPIAPPHLGRALAGGIAGASFVELPDRSHGVPIDDPEAINTLLLAHWARDSGGKN